jgi:hypothetical protein
MQLNVVHYIVLAFIVVIGIIYMSSSMASAMVMAGCLAYILIITNNMANLQNSINILAERKENMETAIDAGGDNETARSGIDDPLSAPNILKDDVEEKPHEDFSSDYKNYDSFRQSYTNIYNAAPARTAYSNTEKQYTMDIANTLNATRRFHQKRAMEGAVLKNADYYKYHYGDELEQAENRPWWGRGEY